MKKAILTTILILILTLILGYTTHATKANKSLIPREKDLNFSEYKILDYQVKVKYPGININLIDTFALKKSELQSQFKLENTDFGQIRRNEMSLILTDDFQLLKLEGIYVPDQTLIFELNDGIFFTNKTEKKLIFEKLGVPQRIERVLNDGINSYYGDKLIYSINNELEIYFIVENDTIGDVITMGIQKK